ncbi:type II toxin-antitoxin system death-on-curing family toxin [Citrobacter sp. Cb008]|uniref:type II toxin-antitoxin system death-on-curing family toxin n=1 Tax=Citrobacter TaxID=544 RepID=UPI0023B311EB|nr:MULTISPECIES: type II toxin-antitoxin system death-on-curing family toxin [Citrobacter]MDE9581799.1 type II toxin-antitoxin system death-on-curing family toxin [Citrobacter braakii]MDM3364366.1 type II toxin-antitoxin system death-on-curing family toxin [Citrobacter sp. Cb005]MDM3371872.1 type II toxin-antitoxin system death-on-curing family toxin [Citrobacter sp. Cb008]
MNYNFLAPELVIQLHDSILAITKGLPGVKEPELVEAVCSHVLNLAHYEGIDDVYTLAAMYLVAIARGHVFNDANKRTAAAAALFFLADNGIDTPDFMRLSEPTVLAAQGLMTVDDIAAVLRTL